MLVDIVLDVGVMIESNGNYWFTAEVNKAGNSRFDAFGIESHKDLGRVVYELWSLAKTLGIPFDAIKQCKGVGKTLLDSGKSDYTEEDLRKHIASVELMTYNWWEIK